MGTKLGFLIILVLLIVGCSLGNETYLPTEEDAIAMHAARYPTCTYSVVAQFTNSRVYLWRDSLGDPALKVIIKYHREVGWFVYRASFWTRPEDII